MTNYQLGNKRDAERGSCDIIATMYQLMYFEQLNVRDPYNMLEKIEMPGFWGVRNTSDVERGVPGQAQLEEIYRQSRPGP